MQPLARRKQASQEFKVKAWAPVADLRPVWVTWDCQHEKDNQHEEGSLESQKNKLGVYSWKRYVVGWFLWPEAWRGHRGNLNTEEEGKPLESGWQERAAGARHLVPARGTPGRGPPLSLEKTWAPQQDSNCKKQRPTRTHVWDSWLKRINWVWLHSL